MTDVEGLCHAVNVFLHLKHERVGLGVLLLPDGVLCIPCGLSVFGTITALLFCSCVRMGEVSRVEAFRSQENLSWVCVVCTKRNHQLSKHCEACKRVRGAIPHSLSWTLPFHPKGSSVDQADKSLENRRIDAFLQSGVSPDLQDDCGWTGVHWAAALGRDDLLALYVKYKANLDLARPDGATPLHLACLMGWHTSVLYLVQHGATIQAGTKQEDVTPLHVAAEYDRAKCIQSLVLAGAGVNAVTRFGEHTPLHMACLHGNYDAATALLSASQDPRRLASFDELLDLNAKDVDGWSAYNIAAYRGFTRVCKLLESYGADLDSAVFDSGGGE